MNYTQLTEKKKVEIDILLNQGLSMRKVASILGISHSTISRYKSGVYKKRKNKTRGGMMQHTKWNIDHKTVLPISLRPKYINKRDEKGHLEIDSIIGLRNEYSSIISIVDRCTRRVWLIKAQYKNEYYNDKLIYEYIVKNERKIFFSI